MKAVSHKGRRRTTNTEEVGRGEMEQWRSLKNGERAGNAL